MSAVSQHVINHIVIYVVSGVLALAGMGVYYVLDQRHEPRGAVEKAESAVASQMRRQELRQIRREIRKLENYERLTPDSAYSPSRQAELAELKDDEKELVESFKVE